MKKFIVWVLVCLWSLSTQAGISINATIENDVLRDYKAFVAGRDVLSISDYAGQYSRRDVIEAILIQQALAIGGLDAEFNLIPGNYDARNLILLKKGRILLSMDTIWLKDAEKLLPAVLISDPVIREGENLSGLYVKEDNKIALAATNLDEVRQLTAVTSKFWETDWRTLNELGLKKVEHELEWEGMLSHVLFGTVDFVLAPFQPTEDLSFQTSRVKLVPIPNLKVALRGSRHFVVSNKHPHGKQAFQALQAGLKQMRKSGILRRAYQQSGFVNQSVLGWQLLNPTRDVAD